MASFECEDERDSFDMCSVTICFCQFLVALVVVMFRDLKSNRF